MEYRNLQDNIFQEEFNERARGITNWIRENREKEEWAKDPNAYEMVNVFLLGAKYMSEGKDVDKETLKEMWELRKQDFEGCGISENNFVYRICEDAYQASQDGRALVNDEASHHALRRMAGIGLYLSIQKTRENKIEYNNPAELLQLVEATRTLSGVHPDLFVKYGFDKNLPAIVKIQPESALSPRIDSAMKEIFEEKTKSVDTVEVPDREIEK